MSFRIRVRRDSAADWTSNDPVLALGEMGYENDTDKFKFGDGTSVWSALDYQPHAGQIADLQAAIDAVEASDVDSVAGLSGTVSAAGLKTALSLPSDTVTSLTTLTAADVSLDTRLDTAEADLLGRLSDASLNAGYLSKAGASIFDIRDYGAECDGIELTHCSMTAGSAVLDDSSYTFVNADIGKTVGVLGAGYVSLDYDTNANDGVLISTIEDVVSGNAVLADVAITTVASATAVFGTPDDAAIDAAQDAAYATRLYNAGGGTVFFPAGRTIVTAPLGVKDYVSWAGVHRDASWVDVILDAGSGTFAAQTSWLHCSGRTASNPLTGASFHDFGINGRCHIRSGGYTASIKPLNIFEVRRCDITRMNVWNTPATSIPFDHAYEASHILFNIVKNPGRLFDGSGGGSGIGIGTHNVGTPEPGLIFGNVILGVGDTGVAAKGNNGIFVEGQSGSNPATPSQGYRITGNYVQGMDVGVADEGTSGTLIVDNTINKCVTGVRIADGGVGGAYPGIDTLVSLNTIINSLAPSDPTSQGQAVLVATNASDNVGVRPRIVDNNIIGAEGRAIRLSCGTNNLDGLEISRNKIRNVQRSAIYFAAGSPAGTYTNTIIANNQISDHGLAAVSNDKHAIYVSATISHPVIQNNRVVGGSGLRVGSAGLITGGGVINGNDFPDVTLDVAIDPSVRVHNNLNWATLDSDAVRWFPASGLVTASGTITSGVTSRHPYMAYPDAATTIGVFTTAIPTDWITFNVDLLWTVASGSGAGDVAWRCDLIMEDSGDTITSPTNGSEVVSVSPIATIATKRLKSNVASGGKAFAFVSLTRVGTSGSDTQTADARAIGLRLTRAS